MSEFTKDPVIDRYVNMSRHSQKLTEIPVFSETLLRIAFKQVFGPFRRLDENELIMYRKLLLYYYSEEYTDIYDLLQIMVCFTEEHLNDIFEKCDSVMKQWKNFLETHLLEDALRQTLACLITEWSQRYAHLHGEIDSNELQRKAEELRKLLQCGVHVKEKVLRKFRNDSKNTQLMLNASNSKFTERDLDTKKLVLDLLPKLSPLLREKMQVIAEHMDSEESMGKRKRLDGDDDDDVTIRREIDIKSVVKDLRIERISPPSENHESARKQTKIEMLVSNLKQQDEEERDECETGEVIEFIEVYSSDDESVLSTSNSTTSHLKAFNSSPVPDEYAEICVEMSDDENSIVEVEDATIDLPTALKYIAELHAYALSNGQFKAGELLQRVNNILDRQKNRQSPSAE